MFSPDQIEQLSAKLDASHVKQRVQAGRELSYIEGWHAIAEANRIFGYDAWTRETLDIRMVAEGPRKIGRPPNQRDGFGVSYIAKVRVIVDGVAREGIGAGHGVDTDLGLAHESAIKEAETDAMKRALMTFGNPFGLALYDKTQENVETNPSSAPQQGRNAPAAVDRTSGAGAPLSDEAADILVNATIEAAKLNNGSDDVLRTWWTGQIPNIKPRLPPAHFERLKTAIAGLAKGGAAEERAAA